MTAVAEPVVRCCPVCHQMARINGETVGAHRDSAGGLCPMSGRVGPSRWSRTSLKGLIS